MDKIAFLGYTAAFCTTWAFIPQVIKTIKTKDTKGISLLMYSFFTFGVCLWGIYGILIESLPVIIANATCFILAVIVLVMKIRYK